MKKKKLFSIRHIYTRIYPKINNNTAVQIKIRNNDEARPPTAVYIGRSHQKVLSSE